MTEVTELFFPPLADCLRMKQTVISWKYIAECVTDTQLHDQRSVTFQKISTDSYIMELLKRPDRYFSPPTDADRKAFETQTAAINVTPGPKDKFNYDQIKDDTKWLSAQARINLIAALRVAIIEYQARAHSQLTGTLSAQEIMNLQEASGGSDTLSTTLAATLREQESLDADDLVEIFEKKESRRRRIFQTWLSERRSMALVFDYFHTQILYGSLPFYDTNIDETQRKEFWPEPDKPESKIPVTEKILENYIEALSKAMDSATSYLSLLSDDPIINIEDIAIEYQGTLFTEMAHYISVIFQALQYVDMQFGGYLMEYSIVTHWFALMNKSAFLEVPEEEFPIPGLYAPLTTLVCATSLLFLNPTRTMKLVNHDVDLHPNEQPYYTNADCLEQIHTSILAAADGGAINVTPIIFVWTILLHHMHLSYVERNDKRDTIQQQKSAELLDDGVIRPIGRRLSFGSIVSLETSSYDAFLVMAGIEKDVALIEQMGQMATVNGISFTVVKRMSEVAGNSLNAAFPMLHGVRIRSVFAEFVTFTFPLIAYQSDNVEAMLTAINGGADYWTELLDRKLSPKFDATQFLLSNPAASQFFFEEAVNRYPLEFLPFVKFCKALLREKGESPLEQQSSKSTKRKNDPAKFTTVLSILKETPRVTFQLPEDFQQYELVYEDENTNSFQLLESLPIIGPASRSRFGDAGIGFVIPEGSLGRFISDTSRIVFVEYPHSALQLMGRRLQINYFRAGFGLLLGPLNEEEVAETISLLAALLKAERGKHEERDQLPQTEAYNVSSICEEASAALEGDRDILTVVCDIMDHYLQDDTMFSCEEIPPILTACVEFLHATIDVYPSRVLSYLARCTILPYQADGGKMGRLTGNLDISSGQFDFVLATMRLFGTAVETVTRSAVYRKSGIKRLNRAEGDADVWLGTADKVLSRVVLAIVQGSIDILETSPTWKFPSGLNASLLISAVVGTLKAILYNTYGIGDIGLPNRLTVTLEPASEYILQSFLSPTAGSLKMQPLLDTLTSAMTFPQTTFYACEFEQMRQRVEIVLGFHTSLLRCAALHGLDSSVLQQYLFKSSFLLARLCATRAAFRGPCLTLLEALVTAAGQSSEEPPSLLGFFGAAAAKSFLDLLKAFTPFSNSKDNVTIWRFMTAVIRNKQQWMSNCLISGQTPREASKDKGTAIKAKLGISEDSAFKKALFMLKTQMKSMRPREIDAVLEFTTAAQNYWPWTVFTIMKDPDAIDSLRSHVSKLESADVIIKSKIPDATITAAFEAKRAAYIAEAFAMQLYHLRHMKQATPLAEKLMGDLDYYLRDGAKVSSFNHSLHSLFSKNFTERYSNCSLEMLKRTPLDPAELGSSYYYNMPIAHRMMSFDRGWHGDRRGRGFRLELALANENLSMVDAQIALYHAWKYLLLELSSCLKSPVLDRHMVQVAQQCLTANLEHSSSENIVVQITESRVTFALTLIQRAANAEALRAAAPELLTSLLDSIRVLADPLGDGSIGMCRTLLKALYVVLRACSERARDKNDVTVTQTILVILDKIVGKGFRAIVSAVHETASSTGSVDASSSNAAPEDLALITAVLQGCLSMPGLDAEQNQILNILATHDIIHVACSLFSWSDRLTVNGDPVYGELSLLFLLELSKMAGIAEQMACDGIVSHLTSANITNFMRRGIISPFAEDIASERCYTIWAKAMLPLLLSLLTAMGATVAPEISYVLGQFPSLLKASVDRLEAPGASRTTSREKVQFVALLPVMEAHSLALIVRIIAGFKVAGLIRDVAEIQWDAASMLENVESWLAARRLLREILVPLNAREAGWRGEKVEGGQEGESRLERMVVAEMEEIKSVLGEMI